jgi:hypothetical protein
MTKRNACSIVRYLGLISAAAVAALLQGCGTVAMSPETSAELRSAPVVRIVKYPAGGLNIMSPKSVAGAGALASATGSSELPSGPQLIRAYGLPDQTEAVSNNLVQRLKAEGGMNNVRAEPGFLPRPWVEDASHYRGKYSNGLVLELAIDNPMATYGAMNWKTYTYAYAARARLIRPSDGKILWSDNCNLHAFADDADKRRLDVSEFEANGGRRFKEVYSYTNDRCSRILADKLLGKAS